MNEIDHIIDSLINGQFEQAKEQTLNYPKMKPMELAFRVGQVVYTLTDNDEGFYNNPSLAIRYLNLFKD